MKTKNILVIIVFIFSFYLFSLGALTEEINKKIYDEVHVCGPLQKINTLAPILKKNINSAQTAIILIPGLNSVGLKSEFYEWKNFWNSWQASNQLTQAEKDKYFFLVFRYDGWQSLFTSASLLEVALNQLTEKQSNFKTVSLVGYSQGGLIARIINANSLGLSKKINKIITLAAPHQGTITLTDSLTRDILKKQSFIERAKNEKVLQFLRSRYKYAYYEQAWTDFDHNIPASAHYKVPLQVLSLPKIQEPEDFKKFIIYGSYIYPPYSTDFEGFLRVKVTESILRNLLDRESSMNELNRWISTKNYEDEKPQLRDNLRLNDGVIPLSSSLWARMCEPTEEQPTEWAKIFKTNNYCPTVSLHRAFYGFNHLAWRTEVAANKKVKDLLHPKILAKSPYEWVISDLITKN